MAWALWDSAFYSSNYRSCVSFSSSSSLSSSSSSSVMSDKLLSNIDLIRPWDTLTHILSLRRLETKHWWAIRKSNLHQHLRMCFIPHDFIWVALERPRYSKYCRHKSNIRAPSHPFASAARSSKYWMSGSIGRGMACLMWAHWDSCIHFLVNLAINQSASSYVHNEWLWPTLQFPHAQLS